MPTLKGGRKPASSAMNRYNKAQKEKISTFTGITNASEKLAIECLKYAEWGMDAAIEYFYTSGKSAQVQHVDTKGVDRAFDAYKDAGSDEITYEGIIKFCADLQVDPADVVMLVIAYHMGASTMGEFSRKEFTSGMLKMNCDSIDKLRAKLPALRQELRSEGRFRDVYQFAYPFSCEKGHKVLALATAQGMWQLLIGNEGAQPWPLFDHWLAFLDKTHQGKIISKDTWNQLFDFIKSVKPDFSNFDENGAWPYLIDEFVDYMKDKLNK